MIPSIIAVGGIFIEIYRKGGEILKIKVIKRYVDKYTKEMVYPSDKLAEVTKERAKELIGAGVAESLEPVKKADNK